MQKLLLFVIASFIVNGVHAQDKPLGLNVNETAPPFSAMDQHGTMVSLNTLQKKGPVVLLFYRGQWCPYCNKQLSAMHDSSSFLSAKGATVVAVTPEKPENIQKTIEKTKAGFSVLFDDGLKIMKAYQVAFSVEASLIEKYKSYGIDFATVNGDNGATLPVPAVYIIKDGKIIYRYFDVNYKKRPSVRELLNQL